MNWCLVDLEKRIWGPVAFGAGYVSDVLFALLAVNCYRFRNPASCVSTIERLKSRLIDGLVKYLLFNWLISQLWVDSFGVLIGRFLGY
jgi:hypothetical protein